MAFHWLFPMVFAMAFSMAFAMAFRNGFSMAFCDSFCDGFFAIAVDGSWMDLFAMAFAMASVVPLDGVYGFGGASDGLEVRAVAVRGGFLAVAFLQWLVCNGCCSSDFVWWLSSGGLKDAMTFLAMAPFLRWL